MGARDRTHVSHPEHPLELKKYKKPYTCDGCKEPGFGSRYRCEACDFDLHKDCMFPAETTTHDFFGNATFKFHLRPPNSKCKEKHCRNHCRTSCDACGKDVEGFVYHCAARDLDLHPCCRNLKTKMDINGEGFRLQDKVSRRCNWCGKKKLQGGGSDVQGWAYASSNEHYYFHVGCVPEMMRDAWQNDGGSGNDDDKSVAAVSKMKMQLQRNSKGNRGRGNKYWKMLKSILKIIVSVLLGDPITLTCVVAELLLPK
ncbi:uncharacterized protein LOC117928477 [Vitis riparia]|uniref:uncharacterized protein LOC117928477 n=1 Tax=Vitis riparia TaxID=96939 RepID=UPI00155AF101|nr:uncharacterized protein LOC117928477 [Vitis riparia]